LAHPHRSRSGGGMWGDKRHTTPSQQQSHLNACLDLEPVAKRKSQHCQEGAGLSGQADPLPNPSLTTVKSPAEAWGYFHGTQRFTATPPLLHSRRSEIPVRVRTKIWAEGEMKRRRWSQLMSSSHRGYSQINCVNTPIMKHSIN